MERIKLNLDTVEAMLYYWQAASEKDNISEKFFYDVANMKGLTVAYDEEFTGESVRRTLSAIKNREKFDGNKKEKKFWNNNMWMMEDLEYTRAMAAPLKKLNIDSIVCELKNKDYKNDFEEIEVIFSPLHSEEYIINENRVIINFFRIKLATAGEGTFIGDIEITKYIKDKVLEILNG